MLLARKIFYYPNIFMRITSLLKLARQIDGCYRSFGFYMMCSLKRQHCAELRPGCMDHGALTASVSADSGLLSTAATVTGVSPPIATFTGLMSPRR